jgi:hypothetical protein
MDRKPGSALVFTAAITAVAFAVLAPPLHATGVQVGILPSGGCPGGTSPVNIFIDNEDSRNANTRSGWIGSIASTGNTQFFFCRVDGNLFYHVPGNPYMVLSLGSQCPHGSQTVMRHFDAEDGNSISSTNIVWDAEGLPFEIIIPSSADPRDARGDVQMTFCLFDGNGIHTGAMPLPGWDYGVFAAPGVSFATASGFLHTDDQDPGTRNRWCHDDTPYLNRTSFNCTTLSTTYRNYGNGAIEGGTNTDLRVVRVKGTVCGDWACRGTETCSTCPQDCGVCQVCGNGICEVNEYCQQDCGFCGDHLCQGSETCSSCCGDCGTCPGEPFICQQQ